MAELRADNVAIVVMADEGQAALTGRRLPKYHRGELQWSKGSNYLVVSQPRNSSCFRRDLDKQEIAIARLLPKNTFDFKHD